MLIFHPQLIIAAKCIAPIPAKIGRKGNKKSMEVMPVMCFNQISASFKHVRV